VRSRRLRVALLLFAGIEGLTLGAVLAWPRTYTSRAIMLLESTGAALPASLAGSPPQDTAARLRATLVVPTELQRLAGELDDCRGSNGAEVECVGQAFRVIPEGDLAHAIEVSGRNPEQVRRLTEKLAATLVQRAPAALALAAAPARVLPKSPMRELVEFVVAHPEFAQAPAEPDQALMALQVEQHQLKQKLKRAKELAQRESAGPDAAPLHETTPLKRRLDDVTSAIKLRQKELVAALNTKPAAAPELIAEWKRLVEASRKFAEAGEEGVQPGVSARLAGPATPATPSSDSHPWLVVLFGTVLAFAVGGFWMVHRPRAARRSSSLPAPAEAGFERDRKRSDPDSRGRATESAPPRSDAAELVGVGAGSSSNPPPVSRPSPDFHHAQSSPRPPSPGAYSLSSRPPAPALPAASAEALHAPPIPRELIPETTAVDVYPGGGPSRRARSRNPTRSGIAPPIDVTDDPARANASNAMSEPQKRRPSVGHKTLISGSPPSNRESDAPRGQQGLSPSRGQTPISGSPPSTVEPHAPTPSAIPRASSGIRRLPATSRWPTASLAPSAWLEPTSSELVDRAQQRCLVALVSAPPGSAALKSRAAGQLAFNLAEKHALSVLLLEAEFERPLLHTAIQVEMPPGAGFSQQLHARIHDGTKPRWDVVECTARLHVLAEGRLRSPGLLWTFEFANAIGELREHYDVIVIDAPAHCTEVDERALDDVTDAVVVVVDNRQSHNHLATGPLAAKVLRTVMAPQKSSRPASSG
jgi:Mrp family chromosome partitioning ATPase